MPIVRVGVGTSVQQGKGAPVARYSVTAASYSVIAGHTDLISAQLLNADGTHNNTAGVTVNWTKFGAGGSLSVSSSTTNGSGVATVTLTVSTASTTTHTVQASDSSLRTGTTPFISVIPDSATAYIVTPFTLSLTVGTGDLVNAQLVDQYNNPVPTSGKVVTWSSTNGGSFSSSTSNTNSSGVASITFTVSTVSGTIHTVTATDTDAHTGVSSNITTLVGAIHHFSITPATFSPSAGASVVVSIQAQDQYNNSVSGIRAISWSNTGGGSFAISPTTTDSSGAGTNTFTASLTIGATATVTATDGFGHSGTSSTITVVSFTHFNPAHFTSPHFNNAHFT